MTNPEAAPITEKLRALVVKYAHRMCETGEDENERQFGQDVLALDAFASAETARADEAESERKRHDAHMLEQLGQVAQERDSLRADCAVLENNMNEAMAGEAKAMQERDSLRARLADLTRTCESLAPLATALRDRDAAIRDRDKARHDCDHETRIRCDERDRRIAAEKRAEAAESRLAEIDQHRQDSKAGSGSSVEDGGLWEDRALEAEARCARFVAKLTRCDDALARWSGDGIKVDDTLRRCVAELSAALAEGADGAPWPPPLPAGSENIERFKAGIRHIQGYAAVPEPVEAPSRPEQTGEGEESA